MLYNPLSIYPRGVDELIFFQDVDISHAPIMEHYQKLIAEGKYTEANNFIDQQSNIHGYFAGLFNLLETRIDALQTYLLTKKKNITHVTSDTEPENIKRGTIWIE